MQGALRIARAIDRMTTGLGIGVSWLALAMILVGAYNTIVRYGGRFLGWNLSSNLYLELQWYLFSLVFLLGAAYTLRQNAHVRVDVLYDRYSAKTKNLVDLIGSLVFLIPFCVLGFWVSWPAVANSWSIREGSSDPGGLPRYPIKTVILIAFGMLILQAISEVIHRLARLRGLEEEPGESELRI
jgi:TRAP-type mannitol/chloroaromatic compound transport system permease small subunit